jgi:NTE family protein
LAGGGSLGAVQVGMLKALVAHGIVPDLVVGASAGAINGAYFAGRPDAGGIAELERLRVTTKRSDIFPLSLSTLSRIFVHRDFLLSFDGLRALIMRHLPYERLEHAAVPIHVVATDFLSGELHALSSGPAAQAIVASCAIPAAFPTVEIAGRFLAAGGLTSNTPIRLARDLGAERLIILPTGHACGLARPPTGAIASALHGLTLLVAGQIVYELGTLDVACRFHAAPSLCPLETSAYDFSNTLGLIDRCDIPGALRPHKH